MDRRAIQALAVFGAATALVLVLLGVASTQDDPGPEGRPPRGQGSERAQGPGELGSNQPRAPAPSPLEEVRPPPEGMPPVPEVADWRALWRAGRREEALNILRAQERPDNVLARLKDYRLAALGEAGDPLECARAAMAWLEASLAATRAGGLGTGSGRYSLLEDQRPGDSPGHLLRMAVGELRLGSRQGGTLPAEWLEVKLRQALALDNLTPAERRRFEVAAEFVSICGAFLPAVASTVEGVVERVTPRVRELVRLHADSSDPALRSMAEWLAARYEIAPEAR